MGEETELEKYFDNIEKGETKKWLRKLNL
jgi:hypothetical protein